MAPHTDVIESASGALPRGLAPLAGPRRYPIGEGARTHRRAHDRGLLWVRITLLIVISALLLRVVGGSRARHASVEHTVSPVGPVGP